MGRADEFLKLHKALETHMRKQLRITTNRTFPELLDEMIVAGNSTISTNRDFILSLGKLRNILVHSSHGDDHLAEPSEEALRAFRAIIDQVARPPLLIDVASRAVTVFMETDNLLPALRDMKAHDYSQIVVRRNGHLSLISPEGISRWVVSASQKQGPLEPDATTLRDVSDHEPEHSCRFMRPDQTVDEARVAFINNSEAPSTRLCAILITDTAKPTEEPLGIVTPWDVFVH